MIVGFEMTDVIVNKNGNVVAVTPCQLALIANKSDGVKHRQ